MYTIPQIKEELAARGVMKMRTVAGWLPLADWQPYGNYGKKLRFRFTDWQQHRVFEEVPTVGFVSGVWEFAY